MPPVRVRGITGRAARAPGGAVGLRFPPPPPLVVVRQPLGFRRLDAHLRLLPLGLVHCTRAGPSEETALRGGGGGGDAVQGTSGTPRPSRTPNPTLVPGGATPG